MANDITPSDLSDSDGQEKSTVAQVEHKQYQEEHVSFDEKATKRLLRKMDIRLIPFLALLYLLSFLDRYVELTWNATTTAVVELSLLYADTDISPAPTLAMPA